GRTYSMASVRSSRNAASAAFVLLTLDHLLRDQAALGGEPKPLHVGPSGRAAEGGHAVPAGLCAAVVAADVEGCLLLPERHRFDGGLAVVVHLVFLASFLGGAPAAWGRRSAAGSRLAEGSPALRGWSQGRAGRRWPGSARRPRRTQGPPHRLPAGR